MKNLMLTIKETDNIRSKLYDSSTGFHRCNIYASSEEIVHGKGYETVENISKRISVCVNAFNNYDEKEIVEFIKNKEKLVDNLEILINYLKLSPSISLYPLDVQWLEEFIEKERERT